MKRVSVALEETPKNGPKPCSRVWPHPLLRSRIRPSPATAHLLLPCGEFSVFRGTVDVRLHDREPEQAARWFVGFDAKIRGLANSSHSLPVADENGEFPYEIRQLNFGLSSRPTHRAIFTIVEPDVVLVLTIRHTARDRITPDDISEPTGDH